MNHCEWWGCGKLESPCSLDKQQFSTSINVGLFHKIWQIFKRIRKSAFLPMSKFLTRICKSALLSEISWLKKLAYLLAKCNRAGRVQGLPVYDIWFVIITSPLLFFKGREPSPLPWCNLHIAIMQLSQCQSIAQDPRLWCLVWCSFLLILGDSLEISAGFSSEASRRKE